MKEEDFFIIMEKIKEEIGFIQANTNKFGDLLGFGDFNYPDVPWPDISIKDRTMNDLFLAQMVELPTRLNIFLDLE